MVFILIAAAVAMWFGYTRSASGAGPVANPGQAAPAAPELMGTVAPINLFDRPPADPFARTAADHWASGAAGIVAPVAKPVGAFTAAQVAAAYQMTRELLIAANLDTRTLLGGAPTAFARLLSVKQRAIFLAGLGKTGATKAGHPLSSRDLVASFAPGSAELIGDVIKVHGTMSARTVAQSGTTVLAIKVSYVFEYAVEPPHQPTDWTRVVDREDGSIDFARWDGPRGALEPWDHAIIGNSGTACGPGDGYIHPDYPSDRSIDTRQSEPIINPYYAATGKHSGGPVCG